MRKQRRGEWRVTGWLAVAALILMAAWAMCGCTRTVYEPVETVRTEYKDKVREIHTTDSVTDTRFVFIKGDTVLDYRDRVKWREKLVHDSIYIHKTDSVPVPYPVEKRLTRWQQTKMDYGGMAIGVVIAMICVAVIWLIKKFRK